MNCIKYTPIEAPHTSEVPTKQSQNTVSSTHRVTLKGYIQHTVHVLTYKKIVNFLKVYVLNSLCCETYTLTVRGSFTYTVHSL
jgi:hypothetical protein